VGVAFSSLSIGATACVLAHAASPARAETAAPSLDTVVVTARYRAEARTDAPLAVDAIQGARLRALRPVQLSDLSGLAPGFAIENMGGIDTVMIRGVGGGGRNIGFGPRTAVYLDGVYIARSGALNQALAEAERVEVLRGPQGALFGANTVSGAVSIVSRPPGPEPGADVRAWLGSERWRGVQAGVDAPLSPAARLRVSGLRETRRGFTVNLTDGDRDVGSIDLASLRATARLSPSAALDLDLSADWTRDASERDGFEAVSNTMGGGAADPFAPEPFEIAEDAPRVRLNEQGGVSARATYSLAGGGSITAISAYRATQVRRGSDNDYSPLALLTTDYADHFGQVSQELRFSAERGEALRYTAGVFYMSEVARSRREAVFGADTTRAGLPVPPGGVVPARARIVSRSTAAFADVDYRFAPRWTLNAGARLNIERRRLRFDLDGRQSGALGIATLADARDDGGETEVSPAVSLTYAAAPGIRLWGRYSEAFKSGGWNVDFLNVAQARPRPGETHAPFAFGAERVRALEAGFKGDLAEGRAHLEATAFAMEFAGYQTNKFVAYPGGATVIQLVNASHARSRGVELSGEARPAPFLELTAQASYVDARFGRFPGGGTAGADATHNRLPFAPRLTLALGAELSADTPVLPGRAALSLQYRWRSRVYTGQENEPTERVAAYGVVDARLAWRPGNDRFEVALWARNLADARYLTNRVRDFLGAQTVTRGDPRTVGAEISARF
jgi:iron complex outermembrane receptor protein